MAALAQANSKRVYSWWWDSHISPKNSKWLQENLTDMDTNVKQMIKLLEQDADSFARRAEMYYKKRPELLKLVEEFYRAYRALAERYDNATGVLRQAHKTMAEAFPNQVPMMPSDDSAPEFDPQTPEFSFASRSGGFSEDSDSITGRKGLKQFNNGLSGSGEGRVRRGLSFFDSDEKQDFRGGEEIASLKKDLARLEAEKEAGIVQYQQSLEESKKFSEKVEQAEAEVRSLQESITRLEEAKNESLLKYQQSLDKIGEIEKLMRETNERADSVEAEAEALKGDLVKVEAEKEAALGKYSDCLEVISGLEEKLRKAEAEVESSKEELAKLMETIAGLEHKLALAEEEVHRLRIEINDRTESLRLSEERYLMLESSNQTLHSELETRSRELVEKQNEAQNLWVHVQEERSRFVEAETAFQTLQHLHSQSQEELRSLAVEIQARNQTLKDMEARNQNLEGEVEKILDENKNLNEVNLSSSLMVKNLQEEIMSLRERIQKLEQDIELRVDERNALQQEIYCLKEELNGLNEKKRGLEEQVQSGTSEKLVLLEKLAVMEKLIEKNLLLENSLSDLNVELERVREKVIALEESCRSLLRAKDSLTSQLNVLTQKFEKLEKTNNLLENSLFDANAEVESLRIKSKSFEDSCLSLGEEKSGLVSERDNLVSQLNNSRESLRDLEKRFGELEEIHAFVEKEKASILLEMSKLNNILSVEREEHSGFVKSSKAQLCELESRILLLQQEAACRNNEYEEELDNNVTSLTEIFVLQKCMKELEEKILSLSSDCQKLKEIHAFVEKEKASILLEMSKLNNILSVEREEHSGFVKSSKAQLCELESRILLLQQEAACRNNEYEEELDKNVTSQTEIFVLQKCMKELEEKILSLSSDCQKLVQVSDHSERQISCLENRNLEQRVELKALTDQLSELHLWLYEVFGILEINGTHTVEHKAEMDREAVEQIIGKVKELQTEIFILHNCMKESEEKISSLSLSCQTFVEASHNLENENLEQQLELKALTDHINELQSGLYEVFGALNVDAEYGLTNRTKINREAMEFIIRKVKELRTSHAKVEEENLLSSIQKSVLDTLLRGMGAEAADLWAERCLLDQNLRVQTEQSLSLQRELATALETSEGLRLEVLEGICREEVMISEMKILHERMRSAVSAFERLKEENSVILEEKHRLEEESHIVFAEKLSRATVSVILEDVVRQNFAALKELVQELKKAQFVNGDLQQKITSMEGNLESIRMEKLELEALLETTETEVKSVTSVNEQLNCEIANGNNMLGQLEMKLSEAAETIYVTENEKSDLQKELNHLKEAYGSVFGDLIVSEVREMLFEEKVHETAEELEKVRESRRVERDILEEKVGTLEGENGELNAKLGAHLTAFVSLRDCVASLEGSVNQDKPNKVDDQPLEDLEPAHDLERRLRAIEAALLKKLAKLEGPSSAPVAETAAGEGRLLTKDIMLDEASECSSYGISRRGTLEPNDHKVLELWDTSGDPKLGKIKTSAEKFRNSEARKEHRSLNPSADSLVDEMDFSESFSETQSGVSKRRVRVLERLDSDVQKLTNLQITLEDLKRKVEAIEKKKQGEVGKGKGFEYDTVKGQLDEAEAAIAKLFNTNRKLAKNLDEEPADVIDGAGVSRRRFSEQARRGSEKIGRIQLELQRIQFMLLKLEDGIESKERSKVMDERSKRVLLRDYLYGNGLRAYNRTDAKRKKAATFCACAPKVIE